MSVEWHPWVEHDGEPHPELNGHVVQVVAENGRCEVGIVRAAGTPPAGTHTPWVWKSMPPWRVETGDKILRYRIKKPQALLELIGLAENLPKPAAVA